MNGNFTGLAEICNDMLKDVILWNSDCNKEIRKAMNKIQNEMLTDIQNTTPVRKYEWNDGVVRIHTGAGLVNSSHQPGMLKAGWVKETVKNFGDEYVLAVRNKALPTVVHLVNFDHDHYSWGARKGVIKGTEFVDNAQEEAQEKVDKKVEEAYGR